MGDRDGYQERVLDGWWGIDDLLADIRKEVVATLDEGRSAVVLWKVGSEKT